MNELEQYFQISYVLCPRAKEVHQGLCLLLNGRGQELVLILEEWDTVHPKASVTVSKLDPFSAFPTQWVQ